MKVDFPISINIYNDEDEASKKLSNIHSAIEGDLYIFCGAGTSFGIANELINEIGLKPKEVICLKDNSELEIPKVIKKLSIGNTTILGVGGGKVCDFSKRVSLLQQTNLILFPTIVANDGLISPISVLERDGKTYSLAGKMPDHVFIDLDIIRRAPRKYLEAAALDLLSNLSATSDWQYASEHGDGKLNYLAYQFSRIAAFQLLDCFSWNIRSPEFLRAVIHGQILSAMAMAYAGSSRPCSGSEHLISHALDELRISPNMLHGEKVGRITRFIMFIQDKAYPKIDALFDKFNIGRGMSTHHLTDEELMTIFSTARCTRPGRRTILDNYSDEQLLKLYRKYEKVED